ncbi:MAG: hypothetical protein NPINA01_10140 [Nitrospinaceae bacterium]|nr:MAG: hypothetical protein NPINA01_10140 [Nitrospinaceae bacterium]
MPVRKLICALIVLMASLSGWSFAQALSLDGNCSNWKVGTLTDSSGQNQEAKAKAICTTLGKSGDAITVFDSRNQSCLLCSRDHWTPGSSPSDKTVRVPNVVGLMYQDALAKLKKAGLKPRVGKASSPLTLNPRQKVLSQETTAGARVSKGETVVINFSKEGFKMPRQKQPLPDVLTKEQYPAFGGRKTPGPSSAAGAFKCDTGIPGVTVETSGPLYPDRKNGVVQVDKAEAKNYICRYKAQGGKQHVAIISFFDKLPKTANGKKWKDHMCAIYALGKGKTPVFINQQGGVGLSETVGRENVMRFYKFHLDQITPRAIPCSG